MTTDASAAHWREAASSEWFRQNHALRVALREWARRQRHPPTGHADAADYDSIVELGANRARNLQILRGFWPAAQLVAQDIAADVLGLDCPGAARIVCDMRDVPDLLLGRYGLVLTMSALDHLDTADARMVCDWVAAHAGEALLVEPVGDRFYGDANWTWAHPLDVWLPGAEVGPEVELPGAVCTYHFVHWRADA